MAEFDVLLLFEISIMCSNVRTLTGLSYPLFVRLSVFLSNSEFMKSRYENSDKSVDANVSDEHTAFIFRAVFLKKDTSYFPETLYLPTCLRGARPQNNIIRERGSGREVFNTRKYVRPTDNLVLTGA
jgi:hypothetical protein